MGVASGMARKRAGGPGAPPLKPNVAALRALAHPLRLRIIEVFAEAPRTTKQVADLLGQPPTRLYHHVAALERAGLLRLKETRKNRGTVEKWFEATARTFGEHGRGSTGSKRGENRATKRAVVMTVLEQSRQEVIDALMAGAAEPPLLARLLMVAPPSLMPAIRERLYAFLKEVQTEYNCAADAVPSEEMERWAMTLTFAPVSAPRD